MRPHGDDFRRTTAHDGRESTGPHVEGFALLAGVVVLDVYAERDAALRLRAMIDDRTDNERRDAEHRKMRANRSPQIVGRPILNRKPSPPLGEEVREPLSVQVKQPPAYLS